VSAARPQEEVLALALTGPLIPIEWTADAPTNVAVPDDDEDEAHSVWRRHTGAGAPTPVPPAARGRC